MTEGRKLWEAWRGQKERRRAAFSWTVSATALVLIVTAVYLTGLLHLIEIGEPGPSIAVRLGTPDGENSPMRVTTQTDPLMQAILEAEAAVPPTPPAPDAKAVQVSPPQPAPVPVPAKKSTPVSPPTPTTPAPPAKPVPEAAKPAETSPSQPEVKKILGSEKGNSTELAFQGTGNNLGRSLAVPIYLFMPLPETLDAALLGQIKESNLLTPAEKRAQPLLSYEGTGRLRLKRQPALVDRPLLWVIIQEAGFDLSQADYRAGKNLRPVVLNFRLSVPTTDHGAQLLDLSLESSSGSQAVDEAVLYGFRQSNFVNGTGQITPGKFTYDFNSQK